MRIPRIDRFHSFDTRSSRIPHCREGTRKPMALTAAQFTGPRLAHPFHLLTLPSLGKLRRLRANVIPASNLELGRASPRCFTYHSVNPMTNQANILIELSTQPSSNRLTKLQKPPQEPTPKAKPTMSTMRCNSCKSPVSKKMDGKSPPV